MKQLTQKEAIEIYEKGDWKNWNHIEIAKFQLPQKILAMPFDVYQTALERILKRPVFRVEFVFPERLLKEVLNKIENEKEVSTPNEVFNSDQTRNG